MRTASTAVIELLEPRVVLSAPTQWLQRGISGGGVMLEPALSPHNPNELFVGTDMSQMFHSKDAGQSWDLYNFNEFVISNKVTGVQFTSDPLVMFALDQGNPAFPAPIRSTDAGTTWQRPGTAGFASNWKSSEQAWRLFADPNSPGRLVVATQDELYLSADSGATFTSAYTYTGTISTSLNLGLHLAGVFFDGANIYAATNAGFLISNNGGSFQTATSGGSAIGGIPAGEAFIEFAGASNGTTTRFWAITHDPATIQTPLGHTAANASGTNVFSGFKNIYTLDIGQANWTARANGLPATTDLNLIAMASNDIDTVYVGGQDTANNFQSVYIGKYTTANPSWMSIYTTKNPGINIVAGFVGPSGHINFSPAIEGLTVDPKNSNRLMMSDGWEAHTSTNGGGVWQQITVTIAQGHAPGAAIPKTDVYNNVGINNTTVWWIHWKDANNIFAAYDDVKWQRSSDGGATWTFNVTGLNQQMENFSIEVDPQSGRMFMSQGRSWGPHDILGLPDSSVTQGGGDVVYSDDGGVTWSMLYNFNNPVSWTALDPNDPKTMYASVVDPDPSVGGVYVSHNIDVVNAGGTPTFTRLAAQPLSVNVGKPHTIKVLKDGTLVLVLTARKHDHDNDPNTPDQHSAGSGVFRLDPGTSQWLDVTGTNMHYWCKDLIVDPKDPTQQTWYIGVNTATNPTTFVSGQPANQPGLYMTLDRGTNWSRVFSQSADSFAVDPNNPTEAYVTATSGGLWFTANLRLADGVTINPNPTFTQVTSFPHQRPNRVFFNPYVPGEVWISSNGAGMFVGNAATALREFHFSASNFSVNENGGSATITVQRTGDVANSMSVDYVVNAGTATNGADFTSSKLATGITGTLTFLPGQSSVSFTIPIVNDSLVEGNETVLLSLSGPIGGNVLGSVKTATLTIVDDDAVPTISINDVSIAEGNVTATFTVTISSASGQTVTVNYTTANGTAVAGADYTSQSGTLTFAPGETSKTVSVTVLDDTLDEPDETFVVNISGATNASISDSQGLGTITDDDAAPSLSIDDVLLTEGNTNAVFTVTLSAVSGKTVTVDYATANGSATSADYTSTSGTLTFAAGETTKTVVVAVLGDLLDEIDETYFVNLFGENNATIADHQGLGTILDDDPTPSLSIGDVSLAEGNTTATFTVTLSAASGRTVTVDYSTNDGSALASMDYVTASGSLTFAPGETTKTILVDVKDDSTDENDENFTVNLSNAINALMADGQGLGTILDNDAPPTLSIGDVTVAEGDAGQSSATFTVSLSTASSLTISVDFATTDDSAHAPGDYLAASGTLTFAPGETTKSFDVPIQGDLIDESDEQFFVNLSNVVNATIADSQAIGTITDDDTSPYLSINDVTVLEGDSGTTNATFTISLSAASSQAVSVTYTTTNNSATSGSDFIDNSGTLTFAPGETTKTVTVQVLGDLLDEPDETFLVQLSNITGAIPADKIGIGTITDDDPTPILSVNDVTVTEGQPSSTFTVTLSAASDQIVTVDYFTIGGTAFKDFTDTSGHLIFSPGETNKTLSVPILDDLLDEDDEWFMVMLSGATNANIGNGSGTGTILDNDVSPSLSIADVTVSEGNSGTSNATFTVKLSAASGRTVQVDYATADGTALAGSDYSATSGTLSLVAGLTSKTFTVPIIGDLVDEFDETFVVNLSNAINVSLSNSQAVGTIADNDAAPSVTINDATVTEGDSGSATANFTISLSAASGKTVTVDFATANGTAVAGSDYQTQSGTLTFGPGETTKTVAIAVTGDTLDEANESFFVNLSSATNATITDAQGLGTITDDDAAPTLSIGDVSVLEGSSGQTTATFTVILSAASGHVVTVKYATANGTATASGDYTTTSGTLTFAAGITSQTISVTIKADTVNEFDETFFVNLSSPTNASIADSQAIGTILDDDTAPTLSINDVTITEGNSGTKNATFTVSLSAVSEKDVTVDYATADNTAVAGSDYIATAGTLSIPAGSTSKTFKVAIKGDKLDEAHETYFVNLSNAINAGIADHQAIGTITDNDSAPSLKINDVTVTEGDSNSTTATFTVTLSAVSGQFVTVNFDTADSTAKATSTTGPATAGIDYSSVNGTLQFAPGETIKTIDIPVLGDLRHEIRETFLVNLSNAISAKITDGKGIGTITDDDAAPTLSISDATILEGDSGTTLVTFTVTLSAASDVPATVRFATKNGSAVSGKDYTINSGKLTFAAGELTKTITVAIKGDTLAEANETFFVNLSSPTNATILNGHAVGTVIDNDG